LKKRSAEAGKHFMKNFEHNLKRIMEEKQISGLVALDQDFIAGTSISVQSPRDIDLKFQENRIK
jgi:hypothetical protein